MTIMKPITNAHVQQYNNLVTQLDPDKPETAVNMSNFLVGIAEQEGITGENAQQQAAQAIQNFAAENELALRIYRGK